MGKNSGAPMWIKLAGLGLLALLTFGLAGAALFAPAPASTFVRPAPTASAPPTPELETALFIGDSYAQGVGATSEALRWTSLVSEERGWQELNEARGGTGYNGTSGPEGCGLDYCPNYLEMIEETLAVPDVIVVSGGQNDLTSFDNDPKEIASVIDAVYTKARERFPDARIIAVGPSDPWGVGDLTVAMDEVVQGAAESVDAEYVSMIDPDVLADRSFILEDGSHVNDDGHRAIADRFLAAITQ